MLGSARTSKKREERRWWESIPATQLAFEQRLSAKRKLDSDTDVVEEGCGLWPSLGEHQAGKAGQWAPKQAPSRVISRSGPDGRL